MVPHKVCSTSSLLALPCRLVSGSSLALWRTELELPFGHQRRRSAISTGSGSPPSQAFWQLERRQASLIKRRKRTPQEVEEWTAESGKMGERRDARQMRSEAGFVEAVATLMKASASSGLRSPAPKRTRGSAGRGGKTFRRVWSCKDEASGFRLPAFLAVPPVTDRGGQNTGRFPVAIRGRPSDPPEATKVILGPHARLFGGQVLLHPPRLGRRPPRCGAILLQMAPKVDG